MIIQLLLVLILVVLTIAYFRGKYNEVYWKKRGVAFHSRNKLMGVFYDFFTQDRALFEHFRDIYNKHPDEPAVGFGSVFKPSLLLRDVTNIQYVTAIDFNSFSDRSVEPNENDVLANNLLFINGMKWKILRQNMSPLFTSTKLKSMYYIMDKCAKDFISYIKENPKLKEGNAFETLSTFCSAAIAAAVFGISTESTFDSPFLKMAQKASFTTLWQNIKLTILLISTRIIKIFNLKLFSEHERFFIGAIKQVISERKRSNIKRHDFGDLCVSLQEKGALIDKDTGFKLQPTDEVLSAQAFFFFNAGVEPTATTMFNALFLLGQHPEVLQRLHEEIDNAFEKNQGSMSYDIILEMEYLEMVLNESMRIYPASAFIGRHCVKDATLPVGNIRVDKGTIIFLPLFSLHHDAKYYPDPEAFKPERFSRENKTLITEKTFMPFGKGNRICIGQRFAQIQAKAGMVHLLRNFTVKTVHVPGSKITYKKDQFALRLKNVDLEFIDRKVKSF